jgi:NADH-quinone oxidoreductase subunit M
MGTGLLLALLVLPLVGALVVAFLKNDDRIAKLTALGVTLVEFVLAVLLWISYVPGGARIQFSSSVDWMSQLGVHLSFGVDGIALVMIGVIALLVPIVIGAGWAEKLPAGRSAGGFQ